MTTVSMATTTKTILCMILLSFCHFLTITFALVGVSVCWEHMVEVEWRVFGGGGWQLESVGGGVRVGDGGA